MIAGPEQVKKPPGGRQKGGNSVDAEKYLVEKKRLVEAFNGEDNLEKVVTDITEVLQKYHLDVMPHTAYETIVYTLQTIHLNKFNDYLCLP